MNENELYVVKEYKLESPLFTNIDSMLDRCFKDCHNIYFHDFKYECITDIKLTIITNNEIINLTIRGENMNLYDLNKKLNVARQNGWNFYQLKKLTIKFYSHLRYINVIYYLKFRCVRDSFLE